MKKNVRSPRGDFFDSHCRNVIATLCLEDNIKWHFLIYLPEQCVHLYSVSHEIAPPRAACDFLIFFSQTLENFKSLLTHLLHVPICARLQIFIQLSPTLTKLCDIKREYLVHIKLSTTLNVWTHAFRPMVDILSILCHIICSKCPPSAETHVFRRLRKSLIALLIVVCGRSSQIFCFYNVNKRDAGYDITSTMTLFAQ